jgi:uncharacterized protein
MALVRQSKMNRLRKRARQAYVRLLQSPGAPREVAGGMALGLFVALLPLMGLQMPIALAIAELGRRLFAFRVSRLAAAVGVWLTNPLTAAPVYGLCYLIGLPFARSLLPAGGKAVPISADALAAFAEGEVGSAAAPGSPLGLQVALALVIGGVVLGVPVALAGYRVTHDLVARYQRRRAERKTRAPTPAVDAASSS